MSQIIIDVHDFILGWKIVYLSAKRLSFCPYALYRELIIAIDRAFSFRLLCFVKQTPLQTHRCTFVKGVVDCFFSRLDCVYGVQSSMCSCLVFLKTHYFSHNLPLFHTSLSLLWQTPRFISWFYEAPPSENAMGSDWLAGSVCCDSLNHQYASERPAPLLSGMCSVEL